MITINPQMLVMSLWTDSGRILITWHLLKVDPDVDELGMLLANLREGTVALDG